MYSKYQKLQTDYKLHINSIKAHDSVNHLLHVIA
jgi:hypothetical protein